MDLIVIAALCVAAASVIGGATGFGTSLIATPLMLTAGIGLAETVVVNLVVALITRVGVTVQLREHIDWRRVAVLGAASVPGAWLGVQTVTLLPDQHLKPAAGAIGGYFSTTTSLNGPPVVLLLGRAKIPPMSFIADLAGYFVITSIVSLALLWSGTEIDLPGLWPLLVACVVAGVTANQLGIAIARRLPTHLFRSAVIVLVVIAGLLTIVTA
ncbi:sulfite exporter TauE/SafE family protein [Dietzia cinnamea]|uniref:sulfite exporter TauE/SafE family protein n=1 Tax=Dietzia cinnamea TaxID=321318 RepID=UPI00195CB435|nr:sulfite exporter TauE/SafE family protein [Dietzia cinnamea]MBM7231267.1 sulfite exporter TauE/SafE family protein [Dietzia cinnamea]MCT1711279.1 sulfite exporter TauE/SafE family protein [Dietzia cinnamea]